MRSWKKEHHFFQIARNTEIKMQSNRTNHILHGKLIWENDIVSFQFDNDDCSFPNKDTRKRIGKVFFSDFRASWSIAMGRNGSKSLNNDLFKYVQNGNRVEVIGNIFDNPELL